MTRLLKLNKPILWKVDWQGVKTAKKIFPGQVVAIFIVPDSYQILEKRLVKRGWDSIKTIKNRKRFTLNWFKHKKIYDYTVINHQGKLRQTINQTAAIIKKELTV